MNKYILCKQDGGIATVTIDRQEALNALNPDVLTQLYETMCQLDADQSVKVVIITGAGPKAFVAGADIAAMATMTPAQAQSFSCLGQQTMDKVANMRPFVIAAINGFALGGGCELALACDICVASTKARMGIPETTLGVIPGFGGTQRLPRLIGLGRAKEMLATGRQVKAEEAFEIGLVIQVVEPDKLLSTCMEKAHQIAVNSAIAISLGKKAMTAGVEMTLEHGLEHEADIFALAFAQPDQKEGMTAFLDKRTACFQ